MRMRETRRAGVLAERGPGRAGKRWRVAALLSASSLLVSGTALLAAPAPAALAAATAVLPTSSSPGTSATTITNYQQVNFGANDDGSWPCGGGNVPVACPGPDGETGPATVPLGFSINFFGTKYSGAYVNNNGNITFGAPLSQFTPSDLTTFSNPIIAPFFADVDTRGAASATVNFGTGTLNGQKAFVVNWPGVGCFNSNSTELNDFQLILIDRADRGTGALGDDFDMEFNYNTVQWDTGQASGGDTTCQNGPAGQSAFVGYSNGTATPGDSFNLPGSGVPNALLDSAASTGLVFNDLNSTTLGRYLFTVNSGQPAAPTTLGTSLSGGGQSGTSISVPPGTAVTDAATLTGSSASTATGTVTYSVYSDPGCTTAVNTGSAEPITTPGTLPASAPVSLTAPGTFYWQATYSGDAHNNGSVSPCAAGGTGNEVETVTPAASSGPSIDTVASAKSDNSATAKVSTTAPGDLLVAYVAGDAPRSGGQTATVSGDGLTWTLAARQNAQLGDAEVWTARAAGTLAKIPVKAKESISGWDETITVVAYQNATGIGATAKSDSMAGAPTGTLTTTQDNSWVFAIGDDWLKSVHRTVGPGQTLVHEATDAVGDTYWVQSQAGLTLHAGTPVTINDTAPATDPYNLILVEIQ